MNIYLTPELERRIPEQIESGLYSSASEFVREGLRPLFETDATQDRELAKLHADIQTGPGQVDRGELPRWHGFARTRQGGPDCADQPTDVTRHALTPIAEQDIPGIAAWVAGHNSMVAQRIVDAFRDASDT